MTLILKEQRPSSRMAQSRKWPKLACSLHARLANVRYTFATRSPSEADRQQKIPGFILSPLGHEKEHYKYQWLHSEKGTKTEGKPEIERRHNKPWRLTKRIQSNPKRNPEGSSSASRSPPPNSIRLANSRLQFDCKQVCSTITALCS